MTDEEAGKRYQQFHEQLQARKDLNQLSINPYSSREPMKEEIRNRQTQRALGSGCDDTVQVPNMRDERINDELDDVAMLFEHWQRNRDKNRTPKIIRKVILDSMAEINKLYEKSV